MTRGGPDESIGKGDCDETYPPLRGERAGEHEHAGERYIVRHGDTLYRVTAASASLARAEVLAWIDDPAIWRGELEAWNEAYYREIHGAPDDVVDVEPAGAFPSGYSVEAACPVCRPGAVADGARPVRCVLHGGDPDVQPTNASAGGFRLAADAGQPDVVVDVEAAPDTPEIREARWQAAIGREDWAAALAIAREPFPVDSPDWPEDARRPWGGRRELARMAPDAGSGS